jgi:putative PIG3 family NAD(P)H quinone oxidoreductase
VTEILGLEFAGTIAAVGERVPDRRVGDRVCALAAGGGYAERIAVHHGMLLDVPDDWTFETAAAVPEVWLTAFSNLFMEADLGAGRTVLIHAGGSGVGTAAIQLATRAGATVIATAGAEEKLARCRDLGAALAVNYKTENFPERIHDFLDGGGVDVILDPIGGPYLAADLTVLNPRGRLILIGVLGGRTAEIDLGRVLGKGLTLKGTRLRGRPLPEKLEIVRRFRERFWPLLVRGDLSPIIDTTFPIQEAGRAHAYVKENRNIGKVILTVGESAA